MRARSSSRVSLSQSAGGASAILTDSICPSRSTGAARRIASATSPKVKTSRGLGTASSTAKVISCATIAVATTSAIACAKRGTPRLN